MNTVYIRELLDFTGRDPFFRWMDLEGPITKEEVLVYSKKHKDIELGDDYIWDEHSKKTNKTLREIHIHKIAYFLQNAQESPIVIDSTCEGIVLDGSHRLCAAIIKNKKRIPVIWQGDWKEIKNIFPRSVKLYLLDKDEN
ncbi:MAG: hypothetical protein M0R17_03465 [Candidatus Omnitrophica bacterium]|nr:hypothetical protein [Candidatus Omnitrophota bacterium]